MSELAQMSVYGYSHVIKSHGKRMSFLAGGEEYSGV